MNFSLSTDSILVINKNLKLIFFQAVTPPNRRSTALALEMLFAHLFGDASSPYIVGILSDWIRGPGDTASEHFQSLQYAFLLPNFVLIFGSIFFFYAAKFIEKDTERNKIIMHGNFF